MDYEKIELGERINERTFKLNGKIVIHNFNVLKVFDTEEDYNTQTNYKLFTNLYEMLLYIIGITPIEDNE